MFVYVRHSRNSGLHRHLHACNTSCIREYRMSCPPAVSTPGASRCGPSPGKALALAHPRTAPLPDRQPSAHLRQLAACHPRLRACVDVSVRMSIAFTGINQHPSSLQSADHNPAGWVRRFQCIRVPQVTSQVWSPGNW
jgi:hypothetical protein